MFKVLGIRGSAFMQVSRVLCVCVCVSCRIQKGRDTKVGVGAFEVLGSRLLGVTFTPNNLPL